MTRHCQVCEDDVPDGEGREVEAGETMLTVCESCYHKHNLAIYPETGGEDGILDVDINGGVTCQNCYSVIFDVEKLLRHIAERPGCRRFTHSDEMVIEVDAHDDICSRCGQPEPENEFRASMVGEDLALCDDCITEVTEDDGSRIHEGDAE